MQKPEKAIENFDIFREKIKPSLQMDEKVKEMYLEKLYYIGEVFFDFKKYSKMKSIVDEILKLNPDDQYGYYNLGVYYYRSTHNISKAYQAFNKAIDINPDSDIYDFRPSPKLNSCLPAGRQTASKSKRRPVPLTVCLKFLEALCF